MNSNEKNKGEQVHATTYGTTHNEAGHLKATRTTKQKKKRNQAKLENIYYNKLTENK